MKNRRVAIRERRERTGKFNSGTSHSDWRGLDLGSISLPCSQLAAPPGCQLPAPTPPPHYWLAGIHLCFPLKGQLITGKEHHKSRPAQVSLGLHIITLDKDESAQVHPTTPLQILAFFSHILTRMLFVSSFILMLKIDHDAYLFIWGCSNWAAIFVCLHFDCLKLRHVYSHIDVVQCRFLQKRSS